MKYIELLGMKSSALQNVGRYALRWPGHTSFWRKMVDLHLLDDEPVLVDGVPVDRKRFLSAMIEPQIKLAENERDIAIVRIDVIGIKDGKKTHLIYQVIDKRDLSTGITAMSRTVGFTASIGSHLIGTHKIKGAGLLSPVNDIPFGLFEQELKKRNIIVTTENKV